ncbi:MAG TPA: hypothetical protein VLR90_13030, partial [Blastocatellia bacterium]|nr:hypothetical protein [Blastocatellia bacterium]
MSLKFGLPVDRRKIYGFRRASLYNISVLLTGCLFICLLALIYNPVCVSASENDLRVDEVDKNISIEEVFETKSTLWFAYSPTGGTEKVKLYKMEKDSKGKLATEVAIDKFNHFVDTTSRNSVEALYGDDSTLWIGTWEGEVYKWDTKLPDQAPEFVFKLGDQNVKVRCKAFYLEGSTLWIGTRQGNNGGGLYKWPIGSSAPQNPERMFPFEVKAVLASEDAIYVGTESGLFICDRNLKCDYNKLSPDELGTKGISGLHKTNDTLWIATLPALYRYDEKAKRLEEVPFPGCEIRSLY